jgi:hypothetical protein
MKTMRGFSGIVILGILTFIGVAVWWLESRFGADVALMTLGGTLGIICFAFGAILTYGLARAMLRGASEFNRDIASTDRYRQMTMREYARGEREAFNARTKLEVLDAKLAQQRAGLLLDLERRRMEEVKRLPQWNVEDEDTSQSYREWE